MLLDYLGGLVRLIGLSLGEENFKDRILERIKIAERVRGNFGKNVLSLAHIDYNNIFYRNSRRDKEIERRFNNCFRKYQKEYMCFN